MKIGFIGQGWIGKNYADDFEKRGYEVVRYALESEYAANKNLLNACEIIFIAVPTPTTEQGFDYSIVESVLPLVPKGKIAVIKSTLLPGTTKKLQDTFSDIYVFHSPEFLVEKTAAYDAANPNRNIVGIPYDTNEHVARAQKVLDVLPKAPFESVMSSHDAEFVKYAGNCFLFTKVVFMNILYDLVNSQGGNWDQIRNAFIHDPRIGSSHTEPFNQNGRGAGGHCFIKDFEALRSMYHETTQDSKGDDVFTALAIKNIDLLRNSGKDLDLLNGVYGDLNKYN